MKLTRRSTAVRADGGLTILEVVLAMAILAMGLAAVISIFTSAASLGVSARQRADAAAALEYVVADVRERLFPLDENGDPIVPASVDRAAVPGFEGLTYSLDPSPVLVPNQPGMSVLYRVDVTVHWSSQGRALGLEHAVLVPATVRLGDRLRRELFGVEAIEFDGDDDGSGDGDAEDADGEGADGARTDDRARGAGGRS